MNETIASQWGTGFTVGLWSPELAGDPRLTREMGHFERLGASPARFRALARLWAANDARADLERVAVPTLVMHDRDNMLVPTEYGRYLAAHIPDSKFVGVRGCHGDPALRECADPDVDHLRVPHWDACACPRRSDPRRDGLLRRRRLDGARARSWRSRVARRHRVVPPLGRGHARSRWRTVGEHAWRRHLRALRETHAGDRHDSRLARCGLPSSASRSEGGSTSRRSRTRATTCSASACTSRHACATSRPPARSGSRRPSGRRCSAAPTRSSPR